MRISSMQTFLNGTRSITDVSSQVNDTQQRISSGRRLLVPSDDPVASARILKINQDAALRAQYQENIKALENRLNLSETVLNSINDTIIRVRELTIQSGDGATTQKDREYIASELKVRIKELADYMNTRDASNEYLFAGFQGKTQPFVDTGGGNYRYQGDEGQRFVKIASSTLLASGDSGKQLFVDIPAAQNTFSTYPNPLNQADPPASISAGLVVDQETFDGFYPEDLIIEFQDPNAVVPPQANFNIRQRSDGRVLDTNVLFNSDSPIDVDDAGIQFRITGQPREGDSFFVESSNKQDLLTSINHLVEGLETLADTPEDGELLGNLIDDTLVNLDNVQTNILDGRTEIGARLNTIDSTRALHEEVDVIEQKLLSQLRDLDYAEAVSTLSFQSFVLEAAQQSFVKISGLSLFNSLR